jgi:hypothetical protein
MRDGIKGENEEFQLRQGFYPVSKTVAKIKVSNTVSHCIKVNQTDRGGIGGSHRAGAFEISQRPENPHPLLITPEAIACSPAGLTCHRAAI